MISRASFDPAATASLKAALLGAGRKDPALQEQSRVSIEKALLNGADPNIAFSEGPIATSGVGLAIWSGAPWAVEALLDAGANPNLPPSGEFNPLRLALALSPACAVRLLTCGASATESPKEPRGLKKRAVQHGRCEALRLLCALEPLQSAKQQSENDLCLAEQAARCGQLETLAMLLSEFSDQLPTPAERSRALAAMEIPWRPYFNALFEAAESDPSARSIPDLLRASARLGTDLPQALLKDWLADLRCLDEETEDWEIGDSQMTEWMGFLLRESPNFALAPDSVPDSLRRLAALREDPPAALALAEALSLSKLPASPHTAPAARL